MSKNNITLEDYLKLDVQIGKVIVADTIPKEKGYLKLTVEFGAEGTKTVITNLGRSGFTPEDFSGKSFPFLLNMEPRLVAKQMSEAMILAASDPETSRATLLISAGGSMGDIVI